jgi:peptidoglycan/xylan/chitin deacetylase (PgdA/CDA1 family)
MFNPVPASQRGRATRRRNKEGRRLSAPGASRASAACSARPPLYKDDAAHAASAPRSTDGMVATNTRGAAVGAALAGLAVHGGPALAERSALLRALLGVRARLDDPAAVALTFDDGPHREATPAVLEILRDAGARASFFLVGEQVRRRPSLAREIVEAGHRVGVHCDRHRNLLRLTPRQVRTDLDRAEDAIGAATGAELRHYRPPYGVLTAAALAHAARRGWEPVLWSRWGRDWRAAATPASVAADTTAGLRGGDILLLHDADDYGARGCWKATVGALPSILGRISAAGLRPRGLP